MWYTGFYAFNSLRKLYGIFFSCISYYGWTLYLSKLYFNDFIVRERIIWKNYYIEIEMGNQYFNPLRNCWIFYCSPFITSEK